MARKHRKYDDIGCTIGNLFSESNEMDQPTHVDSPAPIVPTPTATPMSATAKCCDSHPHAEPHEHTCTKCGSKWTCHLDALRCATHTECWQCWYTSQSDSAAV